MSHIHDGVSCDKCRKNNFGGKRYKCLICFDFDLCSQCYDESQQPQSSDKPVAAAAAKTPGAGSGGGHTHLSSHAMQCILTRGDYELFYGGGGGGSNDLFDQQLVNYSYTCPYCGKLGLSELGLSDHLSTQHQQPQSLPEVVCPICAVLPSSFGGDPNHLTDDLLQHVNVEHLGGSAATATGGGAVNGPLSRFTNGDEASAWPSAASAGAGGSSSAAAAAAAAAALRFSRRINYASGGSSRQAAAGDSGQRSAHQTSAARYSFQFGNNPPAPVAAASSAQPAGIGSSLSSFMRSASTGTGGGLTSAFSLDSSSNGVGGGYSSIDPIAELLSQLTGARRIPTASSAAAAGSSSSSSQSASLHLQHLQAQLNRERESLQQQSAAVAAAISSRHHHHLFANTSSSGGGGRNLSSAATTTTSSKNQSSTGQKQPQAAAQQQQAAINITNAFINQILELPPANLLLQPVSANQPIVAAAAPAPPTSAPSTAQQTALINNRDARLLLSKFDFGVSLEPPATAQSKLQQLKQSLFSNDILLAILMRQLSSSSSSDKRRRSPLAPSQAKSSTTSDHQFLDNQPPAAVALNNHSRKFSASSSSSSSQISAGELPPSSNVAEASTDALAQQLSKLQAADSFPTITGKADSTSPGASNASDLFEHEHEPSSSGLTDLPAADNSLNDNNNNNRDDKLPSPPPELALNLATASLVNT